MKNFISRRLIAALVCGLSCWGYAQPGQPSLALLKAAAEGGDAAAQDKLGDAYYSRMDTANALLWYRKAAERGVVHSQSELGRILIGFANSPAAKPEVRAEHADEAIGWYLKAANQGDSAAQFGLGKQFEAGKFINQDLVEAFKWYELAAKGGGLLNPSAIAAKGARDGLVLKLSQEQIAEGGKRAAAFVSGQVTIDQLPEPVWVKEIKLKGVSGDKPRQIAIINGQNFQKGDRRKIKAGGKLVEVECLDVKQSSVTITIKGIAAPRELKLAADAMP